MIGEKKQTRIFCILHIFTVCYLMFTLICSPVLAFGFDTSVDDEIRKNYNPSKLEEDVGLPSLPVIQDEYSSPSSQYSNTKNKYKIKLRSYGRLPKIQNNSTMVSSVFLKKGTRIPVKVLNNISDRTPKGTKIKFVSLYPVSTTYFTIPMGTVFYGQVTDSHPPQLSANGGLIEIVVNSVILHNEIQPINARVVKANKKNIFLNNIKGKRKYLSSIFKSTKNGRHFFKKMMRVSSNLATDGSSIVIAPFSLAAGVLTLGGNILVSPVLALFHKGGSISVNSGTNFVIKLNQDMFIYN